MLCFTSSEDPEVAVIIGGTDTTNTSFDEVEVYNWIDNQWKTCPNESMLQVPNLPIPIYGASAVYLPDTGIYVCGGFDNQNDCYVYNPRQSRR